ncbi:MAG: Na+/H+ antiporter subunit E, partial [Candidatus Kapaibacterium sp.]
LDAETDSEITLLANIITLTPGTLSIDLSEDRKKLYVHAMYIQDIEKTKYELKNEFEKRLLEVMR